MPDELVADLERIEADRREAVYVPAEQLAEFSAAAEIQILDSVMWIPGVE